MPRCMSSDATAPWCRRTGGGTVASRNQHVYGSVTGNLPVMIRGHGAGEDLGEEGPDRWVLTVTVLPLKEIKIPQMGNLI
jgi:hypothetical protein